MLLVLLREYVVAWVASGLRHFCWTLDIIQWKSNNILNKENNPPEILVSLAYLGWVASFIHRDTQKRKIFSMILFVWTLFFKLLVRIHKIYNIHLKLQKNSVCLCKSFSNFILPGNLMNTQVWINMLDQFQPSLCRKQLFCHQQNFRKTCENLMFKMNDSNNRKFAKD